MNDYYDNYRGCNCESTGVLFLITLVVVGFLCLFGILAKNEARKQGRSEGVWFALGFFFLLNAFIALKVSKAADEEGHSMTLWSVFGVIFGVTAILAFESGLNAENKYHDFDCWCILGFAFGLLAVFISCFLKPFENRKSEPAKTTIPSSNASNAFNSPISKAVWTCTKCSNINPASKLYCAKCGALKNSTK